MVDGKSSRVAVPDASDGNRADHVRIIATGWVFIRAGDEHVVCTANDILLAPGEAVLLYVEPFSHIAYMDEAGGARINFVRVEV